MVFLDILERPCFQTVLEALVSLDILERPCFQTVLEALVSLDILERPCFQTFWGLFPEGLFFSAICRLDSSMRKITFAFFSFQLSCNSLALYCQTILLRRRTGGIGLGELYKTIQKGRF